SLSNVLGDSTAFEAHQPGAYAVLVDGAVTNLAGRVHAAPAFAYLALAASPTFAGLRPLASTGAPLTATLQGVAGAQYACSVSNGAFTAGTGSGTFSAAGTALLMLTAGSSPGAMTVSCFQLNGGAASGTGTAVSQLVAQPQTPVIAAPA